MLRHLGTRLVRGFLILLPVILSYLMFGALFDMLMALTTPINDLLPESVVPDEVLHRLLAFGILVALCLGAGYLAEVAFAQRFGGWVEERLLQRFAPYGIIKSFAVRLSGSDRPERLHPAFVLDADGGRSPAFIVEDPVEGLVTLFVPFGAMPGVGHVRIVPEDRVERLDASMMDTLGVLFNWGEGAQSLMGTRRPT